MYPTACPLPCPIHASAIRLGLREIVCPKIYSALSVPTRIKVANLTTGEMAMILRVAANLARKRWF
jgi:hypothetical protein